MGLISECVWCLKKWQKFEGVVGLMCSNNSRIFCCALAAREAPPLVAVVDPQRLLCFKANIISYETQKPTTLYFFSFLVVYNMHKVSVV